MHEGIDVLCVLALFAHACGPADRVKPGRRILGPEGDIETEERVAVAHFVIGVTAAVSRTVETDRHLHADLPEVAMARLQPAPQTAAHDLEHGIIDRGA